MAELILTDIRIYPVKSLFGYSVQEAELETRGLKYDRRWMLVDQSGDFVSQREYPALTQLKAEIKGDKLLIFEIGKTSPSLKLPLVPKISETTFVTVWGDECIAKIISYEANSWFSNYLDTSVKLVFMDDESNRFIEQKYSVASAKTVSFADGFPYLIIGEAALENLNQRLSHPISMDRFRPNFIFKGGQPHEEDTWDDFVIGAAHFKGVKPCARCSMTTINPKTGTIGKEPLKTLSLYRKSGYKTFFGQNLITTTPHQKIKIGDTITVKTHKHALVD